MKPKFHSPAQEDDFRFFAGNELPSTPQSFKMNVLIYTEVTMI